MTNVSEKTVSVAGCKTTTLECMAGLIRDGFAIKNLLTLSPKQGEKQKVAGYCDLEAFAKKNNINVVYPQTYSLKKDLDSQAILSLKIECLVVIGWQRLIPEWFLTSLKIGAFGMHGSPEPLPRGRGRSPLNWSLYNDKKNFQTNLFKYDAGVDSGSIVAKQKFDINQWDDCHTLHLKNRIAMNKLLKENLDNILSGKAKPIPQDKRIEPTYFQKRTAEDGYINWDNMVMKDLYNHIRCQTKPFPGAFSFYNNTEEKVYFWKAHPFDNFLNYDNHLPGEIVETFHDGSYLVRVWDGTVRITEYSSENNIKPKLGDFFTNITKSNKQDKRDPV